MKPEYLVGIVQLMDFFVIMYIFNKDKRYYNLSQISAVIVILAFMIDIAFIPKNLGVNLLCIFFYLIRFWVNEYRIVKEGDF